jgi:hypothetical protein
LPTSVSKQKKKRLEKKKRPTNNDIMSRFPFNPKVLGPDFEKGVAALNFDQVTPEQMARSQKTGMETYRTLEKLIGKNTSEWANLNKILYRTVKFGFKVYADIKKVPIGSARSFIEEVASGELREIFASPRRSASPKSSKGGKKEKKTSTLVDPQNTERSGNYISFSALGKTVIWILFGLGLVGVLYALYHSGGDPRKAFKADTTIFQGAEIKQTAFKQRVEQAYLEYAKNDRNGLLFDQSAVTAGLEAEITQADGFNAYSAPMEAATYIDLDASPPEDGTSDKRVGVYATVFAKQAAKHVNMTFGKIGFPVEVREKPKNAGSHMEVFTPKGVALWFECDLPEYIERDFLGLEQKRMKKDGEKYPLFRVNNLQCRFTLGREELFQERTLLFVDLLALERGTIPQLVRDGLGWTKYFMEEPVNLMAKMDVLKIDPEQGDNKTMQYVIPHLLKNLVVAQVPFLFFELPLVIIFSLPKNAMRNRALAFTYIVSATARLTYTAVLVQQMIGIAGYESLWYSLFKSFGLLGLSQQAIVAVLGFFVPGENFNFFNYSTAILSRAGFFLGIPMYIEALQLLFVNDDDAISPDAQLSMWRYMLPNKDWREDERARQLAKPRENLDITDLSGDERNLMMGMLRSFRETAASARARRLLSHTRGNTEAAAQLLAKMYPLL